MLPRNDLGRLVAVSSLLDEVSSTYLQVLDLPQSVGGREDSGLLCLASREAVT